MDNKELDADIPEIPYILQPYVFILSEPAALSLEIDLVLLKYQKGNVRKRILKWMVGPQLLRFLAFRYSRITDSNTRLMFLSRCHCQWLRGVTVVSYPDYLPEIRTFCTAVDEFEKFCNHYH